MNKIVIAALLSLASRLGVFAAPATTTRHLGVDPISLLFSDPLFSRPVSSYCSSILTITDKTNIYTVPGTTATSTIVTTQVSTATVSTSVTTDAVVITSTAAPAIVSTSIVQATTTVTDKIETITFSYTVAGSTTTVTSTAQTVVTTVTTAGPVQTTTLDGGKTTVTVTSTKYNFYTPLKKRGYAKSVPIPIAFTAYALSIVSSACSRYVVPNTLTATSTAPPTTVTQTSTVSSTTTSNIVVVVTPTSTTTITSTSTVTVPLTATSHVSATTSVSTTATITITSTATITPTSTFTKTITSTSTTYTYTTVTATATATAANSVCKSGSTADVGVWAPNASSGYGVTYSTRNQYAASSANECCQRCFNTVNCQEFIYSPDGACYIYSNGNSGNGINKSATCPNGFAPGYYYSGTANFVVGIGQCGIPRVSS